MMPEEIARVCTDSCKSTYKYIEFAQFAGINIGRSQVKCASYKVTGDRLHMTITKKLQDTSDLGIYIDKEAFFDPDVKLEMYDDVSMAVVFYISKKALGVLNRYAKADVGVVSDMKFLLKRAENYYASYGRLIGYPRTQPRFSENDYPFPKGQTPSKEQKAAVGTILNSKLSYIWGAPGTGKTQFVLATSILAYIRKGKRVAVFAPTNNSLEQVLRGVLKVLEAEDPNGKIVDMNRDILRLGMATKDFIDEYPAVCEAKGIAAEIESKQRTIEVVKTIIFERRCDIIKAHFDELRVLFGEEYDRGDYSAKKRMREQVMSYLDEIGYVLSADARFKHLLDNVDEYNIRSRLDGICTALYERSRPELDIEGYADLSERELVGMIESLLKEIEDLKLQTSDARISDAKILAMTPQVFMGRFSPVGTEGAMHTLDVDHIFIDEVGYCNVMNALAFFTCGVPITMLGDHMQLPPVCEIDKEIIDTFLKENTDGLRYTFMWDQSALFAEQYLFGNIGDVESSYANDSDPVFKETKVADLTVSHRFGNNLATVLDRCVYGNGFSGSTSNSLKLICLDVTCPERKSNSRENVFEAQAIVDFVDKEGLGVNDFVVLTPYREQVALIANKMPSGLKDNVMTIHKSQGREWGTVILSVSDGPVTDKDVPFRFTSTADKHSVGLKIINTAVSRSKKMLVLVCDKRFWIEKKGELIGELAMEAQ